ncbi:HlyD family type I secretion periplasmic adaptor subunit [Agrobacterium vitis]|uniref:Membrane fusion protein (MFP) family protein n=1 Tax=Agrobacterium vitis TaxID=373 RepID=A0AAE2RFB9_AGRVI|nr:HlyD family type I secretion periplasmic adaptor subunit [Agrobacterium vitis]MBF2717253.1 HlyD family type I secretion periplasmic adaptor subunit [Agrobacterium vitis]
MNVSLKRSQGAVTLLRRTDKPVRTDQEFLAPALEILETPPSPVRMALIVIITALFAVAITWAAVGKIDIVATAQGKIEPTLKVKIVQPLATGKVSDVLVQNGDHVSKDQVLVRLDDSSAASQYDDLSEQLAASKAEVARRSAAIETISSRNWPLGGTTHITVGWPDGISVALQHREQSVLDSDMEQLAAQLSLIDSQIDQKTIDSNAFAATVAAQESLVSTLKKLTFMRETLSQNNAMSTADWLNALQEEEKEQVSLQSDINEKLDADANIAVLKRQAVSTTQSFIADYAQKLEAADEQVQELTQQVREAKAQLDDMTLRSPVDGTIEASTLTSIGQVLTSGSEVLRVVPEGSHLDIQAYITNDEIGFVQVGQAATIKVTAFPYTQYGTISGTVLQVGKDAVSASQAQADLADSSYTMTTTASGSTSQSADTLVFPVIVQLDKNFIGTAERSAYVSPGMSVSVDINTGDRTILDYLFAPLVDVTSSALHER